MANGHPLAKSYPLSTLMYEATLVRERVDGLIATDAIVQQMLLASLFDKDAGKEFTKMIEGLVNG